MKLLTILFLTLPIFMSAQVTRPVHSLKTSPCDSLKSQDGYSGTYVGTTITKDYIGISITSEVQIKFVLLSLQTNLNGYDPTFKGRLGFMAGDKLKFIIFMPMMNLSLSEFKYNTPLSASLRYRPVILDTDFVMELGGEFYKNTAYPYLTISVPFK